MDLMHYVTLHIKNWEGVGWGVMCYLQHCQPVIGVSNGQAVKYKDSTGSFSPTHKCLYVLYNPSEDKLLSVERSARTVSEILCKDMGFLLSQRGGESERSSVSERLM